VNGYGAVELAPIAARFTRVIADASVDRGQRVVGDEPLPRLLVAARLREREPTLNVLSRRARVVARRQEVDVARQARTARGHRMPVAEIGQRREIDLAGGHAPPVAVGVPIAIRASRRRFRW
jgi:hypothetical protein